MERVRGPRSTRGDINGEFNVSIVVQTSANSLLSLSNGGGGDSGGRVGVCVGGGGGPAPVFSSTC